MLASRADFRRASLLPPRTHPPIPPCFLGRPPGAAIRNVLPRTLRRRASVPPPNLRRNQSAPGLNRKCTCRRPDVIAP